MKNPKPRKWLFLIGLLILCSFAFDLQLVSQQEHTLMRPGDLIVFDQITPELTEVESGHIVRIRSRRERSKEIVAKILATETDIVNSRGGKLYVNGQPQSLPRPIPSLQDPIHRIEKQTDHRILSRHQNTNPGSIGSQRLQMPFTVPRQHAFFIVDEPEGLHVLLAPQGDITAIARLVVTNLQKGRAWDERLPRLL